MGIEISYDNSSFSLKSIANFHAINIGLHSLFSFSKHFLHFFESEPATIQFNALYINYNVIIIHFRRCYNSYLGLNCSIVSKIQLEQENEYLETRQLEVSLFFRCERSFINS